MGFLILFLLITVGVHVYVFWHLWCILPMSFTWKTILISLGIISFLMLFLYLSPAMDKMPIGLSRAIYEISTSWLIVLLYLVIIFILLDIGRLCHIVPKQLLYSSLQASLGILILITGVLFAGNVRYNHKQRKEVSIKSKKIQGAKKIIFLSDLHLGYHNPRSEFHRWVEMLNEEKADMILVAGDIIDGNIRPLEEEGIWEEFHNINAPVYACLGNHEYLAGRDKSIDFYKKAGIHLLVDTTCMADNIRIIGRDDKSNQKRKSLKELTAETNGVPYFTVLLDHQPYHLEEAERQKIDLQLSGHTHHGQVWPLNWVTDAVYECAYGYYKKGATEYYVSSGLGIWGGKFRICTCSEYVVIQIN